MSQYNIFIFLFIFWNSCNAQGPLKILFVLNNFPVPSQTFILNKITSLIDRGHDVRIFSFHKYSTKYTPDDFKKYRLFNRISYKKNLAGMIAQADVILCEFGQMGKKLFDMPKIQRILKNKIVITCIRGADITTRIIKHPHQYIRLFNRGDLFLPVCTYFKKLLQRCGCKHTKITVHYSAINCDRFRFKERILPKTGALSIISVCRLVEKKGLQFAIEGVAQIIRRHPNSKYYIVGEGEQRALLTQLIEKLGMKNNIILCGWKTQDEVIELLERAHIFLLPSITGSNGNEEGIPNALKEAMAMGLITIGSWHAGTPELIEHSVSGYLVPQKNSQAIADTILHILAHPEVWHRMQSRARETVRNRFHLSVVMHELEDILYQTIKNKKGAPNRLPLKNML